jgi:hypothetical protein
MPDYTREDGTSKQKDGITREETRAAERALATVRKGVFTGWRLDRRSQYPADRLLAKLLRAGDAATAPLTPRGPGPAYPMCRQVPARLGCIIHSIAG